MQTRIKNRRRFRENGHCELFNFQTKTNKEKKQQLSSSFPNLFLSDSSTG